jgi:hypothetical protein
MPQPTGETQPGSGVSTEAPEELVAAARQQLARHLKVSPDDLQLKDAQAQEWRDGGLGCPSADLMYPQVVTPGYLLVFVGKGTAVEYQVHTGTSAAQMVLCENKQPVELSVGPAAAPTSDSAEAPDDPTQRLGALAQAALARDLGLATSDVTVVAVEEATWNDSSLGCPRPGQSYLQVITPGYTVTLEAQGQRYEYHTDRNRRVVRCDRP